MEEAYQTSKVVILPESGLRVNQCREAGLNEDCRT